MSKYDIDWSASMQQTYECYIVDPASWKDIRLIDTVTSGSSSYDSSSETLTSASINCMEELGECYIRVYMVVIQNGRTEKFPLGTYLIQSPSYDFDGKVKSMKVNAYSPLTELKENPMPIGYALRKGADILPAAFDLCNDNMRAPVVDPSDDTDKLLNNFVANSDDTYLSFVIDLLSNAKRYLEINEWGEITFSPVRSFESLTPIKTFSDDDSSILLPDITVDKDIYGIPNAVEVIYSDNGRFVVGTAENNDSDSIVSIRNRGRRILHRVTNPQIPSINDNELANYLNKYAEDTLKKLSTLNMSISFKHGYYPIRVGDCVDLNYTRAGLNHVKARIISQSIEWGTGCTVTEIAEFSQKLWG